LRFALNYEVPGVHGCFSSQSFWKAGPLRKRGVDLISDVLPFGQRWYYDCLQFADAKDREQPLPPTGVVGFRKEARVVKDRSPVTRIDVDCALISFKEMPITPMKTNHDGGEVACG
jgi:hypothetical protein